jgi:hypothetical protein
MHHWRRQRGPIRGLRDAFLLPRYLDVAVGEQSDPERSFRRLRKSGLKALTTWKRGQYLKTFDVGTKALLP